MHETAEVQAATLEKFIVGWRKWTSDDFLASWSQDCTQRALPFKPDQLARPRVELEPLFGMLMSTLTNFRVGENSCLCNSNSDSDPEFRSLRFTTSSMIRLRVRLLCIASPKLKRRSCRTITSRLSLYGLMRADRSRESRRRLTQLSWKTFSRNSMSTWSRRRSRRLIE